MGGMNRFIALFFLVCLLKGDCSTSGCRSCTTALVGSSFVETCTACGTGFKVSVNGGCDFDVGLVLGVGIGAIIIIALQISCFCFCRMYFKQVQKKKTQYTLQEIFAYLQEERNDPGIKHELFQKYERYHDSKTQCYYCETYPEDKLQFDKDLLQSLQKKESLKLEGQNGSNSASNQIIQHEDPVNGDGPPNPLGPTLKLNCEREHFYHLPCLKKLLFLKPKMCICKSAEITPIQMICVECKLKDRSLKLQIKDDQNVKQIRDYVCAICFKKRKDKEEESKWWKKCC